MDVGRSPRTIEWAVLAGLTPFAAYLVFPLFFLYLDVLPEPVATVAVIVATAGAIWALGAHGGWSVGGVIGPIVGAGVAILIGRAYRALRQESAEHQRLYEDLLAAQSRLAAAEREGGMLAERPGSRARSTIRSLRGCRASRCC